MPSAQFVNHSFSTFQALARRLGTLVMCYATLLPSWADSAQFDPSVLRQMDDYFQEQTNANAAAGYVILIEDHGKVVHSAAIGFQNRAQQKPIQRETRFRIASMTKPIIATVILQLRDEHQLDLDDPVSKYLPEFDKPVIYEGENDDGSIKTHPASRAPTLKELLTHTAGLGYSIGANPKTHLGQMLYGVAAPAQQSLAEFSTRLAQVPLLSEPSQNWIYSYSYDVLGRVIEVISHEPLAQVLQKRIFQPLEMRHTSFYIDPSDQAQLATVYRHLPDGQLTESSLPLLAQAITEHAWPSGGGGLVSTIDDYSHFGSMLLHQGRWHKQQLLKPSTVQEMTQSQVDPTLYQRYWGVSGQGQSYGLGLGIVVNASQVPWPAENGEFAWGGALDTHWIANPNRQFLALIMAQIDPTNNSAPQLTDAEFHRWVYSALKPAPKAHHGHGMRRSH